MIVASARRLRWPSVGTELELVREVTGETDEDEDEGFLEETLVMFGEGGSWPSLGLLRGGGRVASRSRA